jgi:hypothetical protein
VSTNFDLNQVAIIRNAYFYAGILGPGDAPDNAQIAGAKDILNMRTKELQSEGLILRTVTQQTFTLTAGTAEYAMPASALDVDTGHPYVSGGGIDVPLTEYSRDQYMSLTVKTFTGQPTAYYVEKTATIQVFLYPVPDGAWTTMTLPVVSLLNDLNVGTDTTGLMAKYLRAVTLGVAADLALALLPSRAPLLYQQFEEAKNIARNDDTERGSLRLIPDYGNYRYGRRV